MTFMVLLVCSSIVHSQSADKGKFLIDVDGGLSVFHVESNENHSSSTVAVARSLGLSFAYCTHQNFALGIEFNSDNFYVDSVRDRKFSASVIASHFLLKGQYHLVNKEKFNLYVGAKVGFGDLYLEAADSSGVVGTLIMQGNSNNVHFGIRKYFGKKFGLVAETGYAGMALMGRELTVDGTIEPDINNWLAVEDYRSVLRGGYIHVGLTLSLGKSREN